MILNKGIFIFLQRQPRRQDDPTLTTFQLAMSRLDDEDPYAEADASHECILEESTEPACSGGTPFSRGTIFVEFKERLRVTPCGDAHLTDHA